MTGLALLFLAKFAESENSLSWLRNVPVFELGSTLFITGSLVIVWDYVDGRDREAREDERIRRLLVESAPAFRDAVVRGFAVETDDLKRVASPQLLDSIITNAMGLRLGDAQFAREIYADVRDQVIRAPERWRDVRASIRLSTAAERSATGAPLFDILVAWEYTTNPSQALRKFACVDDRDEYYELVTDMPSTLAWFMPTRTGVDPARQTSFELLEFSVDGEAQRIRRSERKSGQTYAVTLLDDVLSSGRAVQIRQVYRTVGAQDAHRLFVEVPVPAHNLTLEVDYTGTDIAHMTVADTVSSLAKPRVTRLPEQLPGKELSVEVPGWLLPRSGFTFVWTLTSEQSASTAADPTPAKRAA